ncbi:SPOR domain-containing protein [Paraburkholderia sp. CNPSo 3274]|uniref:SPOR domain-containing protein n=1 Tax=Paraburkholderia sp. CNPSo 3274 TaxID=2940932 RepID=UPI0020B66DF9|nr:SPOR domain-containing protein [Paraburkholderia sp. CNPSo 3274]MCP3712028.1 SPOR domain-containing protein [Paraburkholderia sp. CNPSo 3274]
MGIFSFGKKDDADAPRRRGTESGSSRRSNQSTRVERRSRRPDRSGDAEAMLLDPTLPEKQRARRRLVGAIALVLAAIVILPMVLDSHPKPVTDDIAIDIPSRPADKAAARQHDAEDTQAGVAPDNPAAAEATPGASGLAAASGAAATQSAQSTDTTPATPAKKPAQAAAAAPQSTQTAQTQKPAAKPAASASTSVAANSKQTTAATDNADTRDGNGAKAESGTLAAPPGARFAVQLGAFSNGTTANNWVTKLKAAGVPAYTEQRKEADGTTRTLLRAGPFPDRASATAAIAKVRGAGLMAGSNANAE